MNENSFAIYPGIPDDEIIKGSLLFPGIFQYLILHLKNIKFICSQKTPSKKIFIDNKEFEKTFKEMFRDLDTW